MSKQSFKVGDRVAVYGITKNGDPLRIVTTVLGYNNNGTLDIGTHDAFRAGFDGYDLSMPHPKQCRKLVFKSPLRRIFVPIGYMPTASLSICGGGGFGQLLNYLREPVGSLFKPSAEAGSNYQYVEFVEVKRSKK